MKNQTIQVINAGIGGQNSRALLARLETDVLSRRPGLVALMVGTNDALNSGALVPLAEYRANLNELTRRILEAGAVPVLGTVPPFDLPQLMTRHSSDAFGGRSPRERFSDVLSVIHDCAAAHRVPLADVHTVLSVLGNIGEGADSLIRNMANSGMSDGVHPTAGGYALIAVTFYQAILCHGLLSPNGAASNSPGQVCKADVALGIHSKNASSPEWAASKTGLKLVPLPSADIVCFGDSITRGVGMSGEGTATGETYPAKLARLIQAAINQRASFQSTH
jgi:lysophospholipase L1-like esterase